jgi:hypothetical protein
VSFPLPTGIITDNQERVNPDSSPKNLLPQGREDLSGFVYSLSAFLQKKAAEPAAVAFAELIEAAFARQRECPGTMIAGAVIQHLVGAELEIALPETLDVAPSEENPSS